MSARPSMWTMTRHSSAVSVRLALAVHVLAVGEVRHPLQRAELLEDELPLVDAAAALHDHRLDVHLDEDVLLGRAVLGAELELAVGPAEEVEGGVLDLLPHRLLERLAVDAALLQQDVAQPGVVGGPALGRERLPELLAADGARLDQALAQGQQLRRRVGVRDHPVAEEDPARLALAADGQRAALGAHLHQLKDIGETELLQVALKKHRPPFARRRLADGPRECRGSVTSIGNAVADLRGGAY